MAPGTGIYFRFSMSLINFIYSPQPRTLPLKGITDSTISAISSTGFPPIGWEIVNFLLEKEEDKG
jgi:hypothetical protein